MTFDTPDDQQPVDTSNDATQPVAADGQPATPATTPTQQTTQQPQSAQAVQPSQASTPEGTVSNTPAAQTHPSVQKASILRSVAETLAGGPRFTTSIDPSTGITTRTKVPLSSRDLGMAIAMEAITGALSGLAVTGPGATGRAAAAGYQQVSQQQQQASQQQEAQAQQDVANQSQSLLRKAQAFESAQRAMLNTAQAERYGVDSLKDAVATNASLLNSYKDEGAVSESSVSQDALMAGMQSGKYDPTAQIAVPDGFTNINGKWEQTFSIVSNPAAKLPLTSEQAKAFADAGVPGWQAFKTSKVPDGYMVPGTMLANANAQLQAINLMKQDVSQVVDTLANSDDKATQALAKSLPNFNFMMADKDNGPVFRSALMKFQKYVSHSDTHGMNFYQSLQQMAQPSKPDPRNPKAIIPNTDAGSAQTIAGAFGNGDPRKGWAILKTYSQLVTPEPIKNAEDAVSIATDPTSSPAQVRRANAFLAKDTANKAAVARAGAEAREAAKPTPASLTQPDALGVTPTVTDAKEANKRFGTFKKNLDDLSRSEQSYTQFQQAINEINSGKWTGADSVVALFNAIGLSAAPLAGRGFRINQNTIAEHEHARGWEGALQAKLQGVETGAVITPQQLRDYANIASQSRANQIIATANQMHSAGINADAALPTGNGQKLTPDTARIFLTLAGGNKDKARQAAQAKGWSF